jgi:hypothetical protein
VKAGASRKREYLLHHWIPFIDAIKCTYYGTPTVQCTFIGRPINRWPDGKKGERLSGLEIKNGLGSDKPKPSLDQKSFHDR